MLDCLFELSLFLTQPANGNKLTKLNSLADNQADHHIGDFHFSIFTGDIYDIDILLAVPVSNFLSQNDHPSIFQMINAHGLFYCNAQTHPSIV